jgi:hypothetical protein
MAAQTVVANGQVVEAQLPCTIEEFCGRAACRRAASWSN